MPLTDPAAQLAATVLFTLLLAFFFAKVEVHIEGPHGWAANLPTWRIEKHILLDLFWGGRVMTGYHAWVFSCIALFFHLPLVFSGAWTWHGEARVLASLMLFWVSEDFLWFVINPAVGWRRFNRHVATWHKHWWGPAPADYWIFLGLSALLYRWWLAAASAA